MLHVSSYNHTGPIAVFAVVVTVVVGVIFAVVLVGVIVAVDVIFCSNADIA